MEDKDTSAQEQAMIEAVTAIQSEIQRSSFAFMQTVDAQPDIQIPPPIILAKELGNSIGLILYRILGQANKDFQKPAVTEFLGEVLKAAAFVSARLLEDENILSAALDAAKNASSDLQTEDPSREFEIYEIPGNKTVH